MNIIGKTTETADDNNSNNSNLSGSFTKKLTLKEIIDREIEEELQQSEGEEVQEVAFIFHRNKPPFE